MFRLSRTSVIAWTAVVAVIAALSYALTGVTVPRGAAEDKAKAAPVEFPLAGHDPPAASSSRLPFWRESWDSTPRRCATCNSCCTSF